MNAQPRLFKVKMTIGILLLCSGVYGAITDEKGSHISGTVLGLSFSFNPAFLGIAILWWCYANHRKAHQQPLPPPPKTVPLSATELRAERQRWARWGMATGSFLLFLALWKIIGHHGVGLDVNLDGHPVIYEVSPATVASVLCLAGAAVFVWSAAAYHRTFRVMLPPPLPPLA